MAKLGAGRPVSREARPGSCPSDDSGSEGHAAPPEGYVHNESQPPAPRILKRILRRVVHVAAYHLVIKRSLGRVVRTNAAGFDLVVRTGVFHPRYFISSELFARFVGRLDLVGKRVLDVGTGTGILALAAARAGAAHVLAVDVNPEAARAAAENARHNGYGDRVSVVCADLLGAVTPATRFDVVISNPPFFPGEPRDLADRAWHAGPAYRDLAPLFAQARERLAADGVFYVVLSSDADLVTLERLFAEAGFRARVAESKRLLFESMLVYELRSSIGSPSV